MADSVWRFQDFRKGAINVSPFQMDYIECFRGTARAIFMDRAYVENEKFGTDNVLRTGYLLAKDQNAGKTEQYRAAKNIETEGLSGEYGVWKRDYKRMVKEKLEQNTDLRGRDYQELEEKAERVWQEFIRSGQPNRDKAWDEPLDTRRNAVYFSNRAVAENYATRGGIILRAIIPTDECWIVDRFPSGHENMRIPNQRHFEKNFDVESFRKEVEVTEKGNSDRGIQVVVGHEVPLEWIKEIKDPDIAGRFVTKKDYVRALRRYFAHEMEKLSEEIAEIYEENVSRELKLLENIHNLIGKLYFYLEKMTEAIDHFMENHIKNTEAWGKNYELPPKKKQTGSENVIPGHRPLRKAYLQNLKNQLEKLEKIITGEQIKGEGYTETRKQLFELVYKEFDYFQKVDNSAFYQGFEKRGLQDILSQEQIDSLHRLLIQPYQILEDCQRLFNDIEDLMEAEMSEDIPKEDLLEKIEREVIIELKKVKGFSSIAEDIEEIRETVTRELQALEKEEFQEAYNDTRYIPIPLNKWKKVHKEVERKL